MHLFSQSRKSEKSIDLSKVDSTRCEQDANAYYSFFFEGIEFQTQVDLENVDIIRSEDYSNSFFIRFLKLCEWGDHGSVELVETWSYAEAAERDEVFRELWPRFMNDRYPIERA